jgi:putative flippase GtrA
VAIVIVDDGSTTVHRPIFDQLEAFPGVTVLRHAVNLGKGAALKTGINFILCQYPAAPGVVTADADGQHHVSDILKICSRMHAEPDRLVLGVRSLERGIPLRSRFGNQLTRSVLRLVLGQKLTDTQTGLRAIPRALMAHLLKVAACGYEFELEMLIAVKHKAIGIVEEPIRTIYEPGNPTSHFQPIFDSMRIYFVLLRFTLIALLTAVLDNSLFFVLFGVTGSAAQSLAGARLASILFNYSAVRSAAFQSEEKHSVLLPRYLALVLANSLLSYAGIRLFGGALHIGVFPAKLLAESLLFVASFTIQRDLVFTSRKAVDAARTVPGPAPAAVNEVRPATMVSSLR